MIGLCYLLTYSYLLIILLSVYLLNKKFKIQGLVLRKIVHLLICLTWFISYYFFKTSYHMLIVPFSFVLINYLAYQHHFSSLLGNESLGIVYYPLSVLLMAGFTYFENDFYLAYGIGFLVLGLADGLAPLVGCHLKSSQLIYGKTLSGSLTVFLVTLMIVISFQFFFLTHYSVLEMLIIALSATFLELIGTKGLDNLYLPLGVSTIVYFLGVI